MSTIQQSWNGYINILLRWKKESDLVEAHLEKANLEGINLKGANLKGANLDGANFIGAHLERDLNLSIEQLSKVKTLYNAKLDEELEIPLREKYLALFEKPDWIHFWPI